MIEVQIWSTDWSTNFIWSK